jgi:hypothetical protein
MIIFLSSRSARTGERADRVPRIFFDLVSNTNTHAARTRMGTHEARPAIVQARVDACPEFSQ